MANKVLVCNDVDHKFRDLFFSQKHLFSSTVVFRERKEIGFSAGMRDHSQALPVEAPDLNPAAEFCQREVV